MKPKTEIEYLREKVEELQKENIQLRIKIDRLERDKIYDPPSITTPIPLNPIWGNADITPIPTLYTTYVTDL